jgi:DNA-binding cell septation regulator SpoVG
MQQKANEIHLLLNNEVLLLKDVKIIETEDGLYVEDSFKLGTDDDGKDIIQRRLTYYRRETILKIIWTENSLVDSIKENVLAEIIQDKFEHLMDTYEDYEEEEMVGTPKADRRDDPEFNPYGKKDE